MNRFWYLFYNAAVVPAFWALLSLGFLLSPKIRRAIIGRRGMLKRLEHESRSLKAPYRIWFHSSSMGEFEQAKPIIAALRKQHDDIDIIVTFFSPSGYDHSRAYKTASLISYIPFDSAGNARRFLDLIKPTIAVMVRYDIWPNHVWQLKKRGIPILIANATLRNNSARFYPLIRNFHHYLYDDLTSILTVSESDANAFARFSLRAPMIKTIGDTRYDQVWQRSQEARTKHLIPPHVLKRRKVFVVGSSWEEDEEVLIPAFLRIARHDRQALMILVPHEPTIETLERIDGLATDELRIIRFSDLIDYSNQNVILVDSIGILTALYQYAHVAYVGGSFRQGVHNVLEPAVYGIPVLFGPQHENSQEAVRLVAQGGGFVALDREKCYSLLRKFLHDPKARERVGEKALGLVQENIGATERFIAHLEEELYRQKNGMKK